MLSSIRAFIEHLIAILAGTWPASDAPEVRHAAARSAFEALEPADMIEAMLTARMIAAHNASMDGFARAMLPGVTDADAIRLRNSAATAGRSFDAALNMLKKHRAPPPAARTRPAADRTAQTDQLPDTRNPWNKEHPLDGFTPEEIAEAEYALDNDPVELARAELAQRIPLHRAHDMTMEERRIAYAEQSERTPAQWAVASARMIAAAKQRNAERAANRTGQPSGT
jgi:hypothetical protein